MNTKAKNNEDKTTGLAAVECCPTLEPCAVCDVLNFTYQLPFRPMVNKQTVQVEVTLHFRLTRCSGPLSLGDLLYTTTLLPGEQVRLFSSDRHSRFTFDSSSKLSYHNETTSEESYYAAGMAHAMSNLSVLDTSRSSSSFSSSSVSGGGGAGLDLGIFSIGGSVAASSYDANSASSFAHQLTQHADSSQSHVEVSTRAAASTSIGEVATRTHQQSESEDQYESASRVFSNANRCHALTFLFYRINKCQTVRFELVSIDRRLDDPAMPTQVQLNPPQPATKAPVLSSAVLATSSDRVEVAQRVRTAVAIEQGGTAQGVGTFPVRTLIAAVPEPIQTDMRKAALQQVDKDLVAEGLLDKVGGKVSPEAVKQFSWDKTFSLPTPGVMVKGCLDACCVCEPELEKQIQLELENKQLQNQLLQKQIDLLEKSQEYRCCPPAPTPAP